MPTTEKDVRVICPRACSCQCQGPLLELLSVQDKVGQSWQGIAGLMLGRQMADSRARFQESFQVLRATLVDASRQALKEP